MISSAAQRKQFPTLPKSRSEFHETLSVLQLAPNNNENLVLFNDDKINIVLFFKLKATNMRLLSTYETIFADGTSYNSPKYFTQISIIKVT